MLAQLLGIIAGILALIGAGAISYVSLEQTFGLRTPSTVTEQTQTKGAIPEKTAPLVAQKTALAPKNPPVVPQKTSTPTPVPAKTSTSLTPAKPATTKTVVAPGPLRATTVAITNTATHSSDLTVQGVIVYTNSERAQNGGLPALTENALLDQDAQMKVADMFAKQYFEHVSPSGVGPGDLAKAVGYQYVLVGENLALGDFGSDQGVLTAWMNSPGHRANILNTHYTEIGVAVGKGMYEGRMTWLAVQSFGMPLSACPEISAQVKAQIDANNIEVARLRAALDAKKAQIAATSQSDPNYNTYANEFNMLVPQYNTLVEVNRNLVANYNLSVQLFNDCINSAGTASIH